MCYANSFTETAGLQILHYIIGRFRMKGSFVYKVHSKQLQSLQFANWDP